MSVEWNAVAGMKLNQMVERILHVPGNFSGGILEMTIVFDMALEPEIARGLGKNIAGSLKKHSEVFRNVRLNMVQWKSDMDISNEIVPLIQLTMDSFYQKQHWGMGDKERHLSVLAEYLRLFHARSKVILFITGNEFIRKEDSEDYNRLKNALEPFLGKKLGIILWQQGKIGFKYREY